MSCVLSGHQDASRRRTDGRPRVVISEFDALGTESIKRRRPDVRRSKRAEVAIARIIQHHVNDVRLARCFRIGHTDRNGKRCDDAENSGQRSGCSMVHGSFPKGGKFGCDRGVDNRDQRGAAVNDSPRG